MPLSEDQDYLNRRRAELAERRRAELAERRLLEAQNEVLAVQAEMRYLQNSLDAMVDAVTQGRKAIFDLIIVRQSLASLQDAAELANRTMVFTQVEALASVLAKYLSDQYDEPDE